MDSIADDITLISGIPAVPTILDVVCRTTRMGFAAVARVTDERWVACSVLDNIHFGLKPGGELELKTTICHEIRQAEKAVVIDHVAEDEIYRDHHTPRQYGFQSYISVPIFLPGRKFFGTLCAIDPHPAKLNTPEVIGMFQLFANLIASHIDASDRLARTESHLVAEREGSGLREQFIGVLGHDLRNPLGALSMGVTMLKRSPLSSDQSEIVDMMQRSVRRMSDLIEDAMDFTRGRLGGGIPLDVLTDSPIEPVLQQVIDEIRAIAPGRAISTEFALSENPHYDRKRIAQLFTNLMANAITHGLPGTPITVRATSGGGSFELSVANAADPIPPSVIERLFEPFSRGGRGDYQQGMGLGLYIASEIARSHEGTINVRSDEAETRFTLSMPTDLA